MRQPSWHMVRACRQCTAYAVPGGTRCERAPSALPPHLLHRRDLRKPRRAAGARDLRLAEAAGGTGDDEDEDDDVAFSGDFDSCSSSEGEESSHCGGHDNSDGWSSSNEEEEGEEEEEEEEEEGQAWKQLPASTLELVVEAEHRRCVISGSALSAGMHGHGGMGGPAMRLQPAHHLLWQK